VTASGSTPTAYQVNDKDYQCNREQQMNQTAGYVQAKTEKPQNQKHNENCPKHIDLPCEIEPFYVAGASDLPHSRQADFARGVINPQNGHTLCDAYP
jgi:hypothetical protein